MGKRVVCENEKGNSLTFTYDDPYWLTGIEGIHELSGSVSGVKSAFGIGERYIGTSVNKRNIIINGIISDHYIERRKALYQVFPMNQKGTFFYYEEDMARKIEYVVEDIKIQENGRIREFSISLICHNPYFTDVQESKVTLDNWEAGLEFPVNIPINEGIEFGIKNLLRHRTIKNDTNIDIGLKIKFVANDIVVNPGLININTQEQIVINKTMEVGDEILITTSINNKNVYYVHDGTKTRINNSVVYGSKFLQVYTGGCTFKPIAESGFDNLMTEIVYSNSYEAV